MAAQQYKLKWSEETLGAMYKGTLMETVMKIENITHLMSSHLMSPPTEAQSLFIIVTFNQYRDTFKG